MNTKTLLSDNLRVIEIVLNKNILDLSRLYRFGHSVLEKYTINMRRVLLSTEKLRSVEQEVI